MSVILRWLSRNLSDLVGDRRGATAAVLAMSLATLVGFAGLGIETGFWFSEKRNYQTATDAAAISGAFQVAAQLPNSCSGGTTNPSQTPIFKAATTMSAANGYKGPTAVAGSSVATTEKLYINNPPTSGAYTSNYCAVEAILYEPKNSLLAGVYKPNVTIGTRAVALVKLNYGGGACILSLDPNAGDTKDVDFQGTPNVDLTGCVVAANSPNSCSINLGGNPSLTASALYTVGGDCTGGNPTTSAGLVNVTGGAPIPDPFCSQIGNCSNTDTFTMPTCSGSIHLTANGSTSTISGGAYSSIQVNSGTTLTATGTVYVCGDMTVSGTLNTGTGGATFIVTGKISVTGSGTMTAPSSGTYSGILFYQPGNGSNTTTDKINGGSSLVLTGAIYLPGGNLTFNGTDSTSSPCLEVVAYQVAFSGTNSQQNFTNSSCASDGVQLINVTNVIMAEQ